MTSYQCFNSATLKNKICYGSFFRSHMGVWKRLICGLNRALERKSGPPTTRNSGPPSTRALTAHTYRMHLPHALTARTYRSFTYMVDMMQLS